jgi:transitional endoplasmic reticulum ATPase
MSGKRASAATERITTLFVFLHYLSVVAGPLAFVLGMLAGGRSGDTNLYAGFSVASYNLAMSLSWLPFLLVGLCCELLILNPCRLNPYRARASSSIAAMARLTVEILLCYLLLWVSAAWAGSVLGQVWQILPWLPALFKVPLAAALMVMAYRMSFEEEVVGWDRDAESTPADETVQPARVPAGPPAADQDSASRSSTYEFAWTQPSSGLEALSGMADLKTELAAALQGFRAYAKRGPISDRNGILLSGPPGNGKTAFAEAIAGELGLPFVKLGGQDLTSKWVNESQAVLKDLFRQAAEQPCVVFFDEFDGVAMNRGNNAMHSEDRKLVNALLSEIDTARKKHIVLIAATNYVEQLDGAIARDGRFDFRIEIPFPDQEARVAILRGLLRKFNVKTTEATIIHVGQLWERRSVAFIEATVKRLRDNGKGIKGGAATIEDFKLASRQASRRASAIPNSGARLSEIALTSTVRREADSLVYRLRNWEQIAERGGEPPSGVLLYGPPGTGKTSFVRALARELEYWHVFEVNAADVLQDPRKFRDIMELAANHRPAIVFIDEADELLRERTQSNAASATNEILKAMDGMMGRIPEIVFMAATNNPEIIDGAALRGGRFAEKIFMGRLTGQDLVTFFEKDFASKNKVRFASDLTPQTLAAKLIEAAPSDALGLLRKAINYTFGQAGEARPVCMADVDKAIESMQF